MEFESELEKQLDQRVESFISEWQPSDGSMFTYSKLMPVYEEKLRKYSKRVYGRIDESFIAEQLEYLNQSINPTVMDLTDGTDEILSRILHIELAKIIFDYGVDEQDRGYDDYGNKLDDGNEALRRASIYSRKGKGNQRPLDKFHEKLGDYIHRYKNEGNLDSNSGCLVTFLAISGLSLIFALSI